MDAIQEAFSEARRNATGMQEFGALLRQQFSMNKSFRRAKEQEWMESLRQYKGLYDPDVVIEPGNSRVYPKLTRSKCNMVLSRLHEMLFPETDKNWEIMPTPEPKIAPEIVKGIAMTLLEQAQLVYQQQLAEAQQMIEAGEKPPQIPQPQYPSGDDLRMAIAEYAKATCEKMSIVIDDQLTEMDYSEETKKVLNSGLKFGTGIMKGPLINKRTKRTWEPSAVGDYEESLTEEEVPYLEFTRIWDWYPDMSTTDLEKMDGCFERHVMTKHDLRELMQRDDFFGDIIKNYMAEHPEGDYVPEPWEIELQVIEIEAGTGKSTTMSGSSRDQGTNRKMGRKYEVLEYWGYVDGQDMAACGIDIEDTSLEYEANIWIIGNQVIKAALYDRARHIYKVFYYEKDETSIFGEGLARIMRHSQLSIAGAARMLLDNASCVSGPQLEANISLLYPGTDVNNIYPRKIWHREGRGVEAQYPALRAINFDSHIEELISIIREFKTFGDEETTLPTWMIGQAMPNETAQGTSMRMSAITISVKDVVRNFDAFTEKVIRDLYAWNMEFNPRSDIKGDYGIKAKGVSSLVMKEVRMQAMNQMAASLQPEDWVYIPRRDYLKEWLKAHDLNISLRSEEEAQKIISSQQDQRAQELAYAQMAAEIEYKKAQTMGQLTKAKKVNVEAARDAQTPPETTPQSDPRLTEGELALQSAKLRDQEASTRRAEEKHRFEMNEQATKNRIELATRAAKADADITNKQKTTNHSLKMKEMSVKNQGRQKKEGMKNGK